MLFRIDDGLAAVWAVSPAPGAHPGGGAAAGAGHVGKPDAAFAVHGIGDDDAGYTAPTQTAVLKEALLKQRFQFLKNSVLAFAGLGAKLLGGDDAVPVGDKDCLITFRRVNSFGDADAVQQQQREGGETNDIKRQTLPESGGGTDQPFYDTKEEKSGTNGPGDEAYFPLSLLFKNNDLRKVTC